jgi:hypothetical protein
LSAVRLLLALVLSGAAHAADIEQAAVAEALARGETAATRAALRDISARTTLDHAADVFVAAIESIPRNRAFRERFDAVLEQGATMEDFVDARNRYRFLFVPGWLYRDDPATGADFARPRAVLEQLGLATALAPLDENGTIEANAQILADEVIRSPADGRMIILVSTSKGGPEAHLALDSLRRTEQAGQVVAWVNIGGLLNGTAVADYWMQWPRCWLAAIAFAFKGFGTRSIASMTTRARQVRFAEIRLPEDLLVVNYLGVPRFAQMHPRAQERNSVLAAHGPNDGLTLLADAIVPQGFTLLERGLDHYFAAPDLDRRIVALARVVIAEVDQRGVRASGVRLQLEQFPTQHPIRDEAEQERDADVPDR